MARIEIALPDTLSFATDIPLHLFHMNRANHLDNALLLSVVSEGRERFFRSLGYAELDVDGVGIIIADAAVVYRSEAHHGEVMRVRMAATDFNKYGCDLMWLMSDVASDREVARGKTGIVFFDYAMRRICPVPPAFRGRFP